MMLKYRPFWKETDSFYGQDFIWCYLGNFGGATAFWHYMDENVRMQHDSTDLLDYAAKDLDGLMEEYYKPRWEMFFDAVFEALDSGKHIEDLSGRLWEFECGYAGIG